MKQKPTVYKRRLQHAAKKKKKGGSKREMIQNAGTADYVERFQL